jgi:hypothetical protein
MKRQIGGPSRRWKDDFKMYIKLIYVRVYTRFKCLGIVTIAGFCEHGNEVSGSIKGGEFVDQLSDFLLLKEYCVPRR